MTWTKAILAIILLAVSALPAQIPDWLWAVSAGGYVHESAKAVATDSFGNIYLTGYMEWTIGFGDLNLTGYGNYDIFVAKLDPAGNWLWAVHAGGTGDDGGGGIAICPNGDILVCGSISGAAQFGTIQLNGVGTDGFVARLDSDGNWLWAVACGGTGWLSAYAIGTDATGNCYVTGGFTEVVQFGTGFLTSQGGMDGFVAKLGPDGNWIWSIRFGSDVDDCGYGLAVDADAQVHVCGNFHLTANFGATSLTSLGGADIFTALLDSGGNWLWARQAGGNNNSDFIPDVARGVASDDAGNTYIVGNFQEWAEFGQIILSSGGASNADVYVAKLDPEGNWLWVAHGQGDNTNSGYAIALHSPDRIAVCGAFYDTAVFFGPGEIVSEGNTDIFCAGLDALGNWTFARRAGGGYIDLCYGIAFDAAGNTLVAGYFMAEAVFGDHPINSTTGMDLYVAKLGFETAAGDPCQTVPALISGLQCQPNPFHSSASVSFKLRDGVENLDCGVYDLRGRKVASLHQGRLERGEHVLSWEVKGLPAGIYLYRLTADGFSASGKLVKY